MELQAAAVAADFPDDGKAVGPCHGLDDVGHVAQGVPGLHLFQAGVDALPGHIHQLLLFRGGPADDEHAGGVGKIPVQDGAAVDVDDVAFLEHPVAAGDAVADHLVDGRAHGFGIAFIIEGSGNGTGARGLLIDPAVDFLGGDAFLYALLHIVQDVDVDLGASADAGNLLFGFEQGAVRHLGPRVAEGLQVLVDGGVAVPVGTVAAAPAGLRGIGGDGIDGFVHEFFFLLLSAGRAR